MAFSLPRSPLKPVRHLQVGLRPGRKVIPAEDLQVLASAAEAVDAAVRQGETIVAQSQAAYEAEKRRGYEDGLEQARMDSAEQLMENITRSVEIRMDDQMRFTPSRVDVREGETIRFVVRNAGKTAHEMVLGSDAEIREHAQAMQQGLAHQDGHSHGTGAAITVPAGHKGELVVKFDQASTLQMACLIPGHYEAGMRGTVKVSEGAASTATPKVAEHDHSTHKH